MRGMGGGGGAHLTHRTGRRSTIPVQKPSPRREPRADKCNSESPGRPKSIIRLRTCDLINGVPSLYVSGIEFVDLIFPSGVGLVLLRCGENTSKSIRAPVNCSRVPGLLSAVSLNFSYH